MWSFSRQTTDSTSQNPAAGVCVRTVIVSGFPYGNYQDIQLRIQYGFCQTLMPIVSFPGSIIQMGREWLLFRCNYTDQPIRGTAASVKTIGTIWWQID